jgi:prepilin signal peptidase PulO-like enzyme (type II secretory pathway)
VPVIEISGRTFLKGRSKCPSCGHKFRYLLPMDALLFWDGSCATCGEGMPELPDKGKIGELMELKEWD